MKTFKKLLSVFLVLVTLNCVPVSFAAAEMASGTCGDNLTWTLSDDYTLTISGTGAMDNYSWGDQPWVDQCWAIVKVVVGSGVTSIGDYAFASFESLEEVELPETLTGIGEYAFGGCALLTEIDLPDSLTTIGAEAFASTGLVEVVMGNGVTSMAYGAFGACSSLKSIKLSTSLTELESGLFAGCHALKSVEIPAGVTSMGDSLFEGCSALESITIPTSVTEIGHFAFNNCSALTTVNYGGTEAQWNAIDIGDENDFLLNAEVIFAEAVELTAPTVTATNIASTGKIKLSWNKVDGAEKYELWASTSKNGTYSKLGTVTGTSATHSSAKAGKTYYYKVRAIAGDVKGPASAAVGKTCDLAQPVITVTNKASTGKNVISWKKIDGATGYELWASTSENGTYSKLGTVSGTSATHSTGKAGKTYYYKVRAIISGNSGATSATSKAVGRTCDLASPVLTVKLNSKGKPVLSWKKIDGAVKYEIYACRTENGTYTKLGTVSGTSVAHSSAKAGVTYYYKVRAICSVSAATSAFSAVQYIEAK